MFASDVDARLDVVKLLLDHGADPNHRRQVSLFKKIKKVVALCVTMNGD